MKLVAASVEALVILDRACFSDPYSESLWKSYLSNPQRFPLFLFEVEAELVGYASFSVINPEAELLRIGVVPEFRGLGYAAAALELAQQQLHQNGIERILLEVREGNEPAQKLYQSLGYINDGRRPGYYPATSGKAAEDAVLMSLDLG